jgi:hypothetical protein
MKMKFERESQTDKAGRVFLMDGLMGEDRERSRKKLER